MTAQYLIRMDDACHTMDRHKWKLLEEILDELGINPIVAVVPDNQDPDLVVDSWDDFFWEKVQNWQKKGWTIAMHGYTHLMHPTENKLLLPYYKRSEFAGLPYEEQVVKIRKSWNIFKAQNIEPNVWIAPAHSFDSITLRAIHNETSLRIISDGIARDVYYELEFYWIPQQLWELTERNSGIWTVCLHPNTMTVESIITFSKLLRNQYKEHIIKFQDIVLKKQKKSFYSHIYNIYFWQRRRVFMWINSIVHGK